MNCTICGKPVVLVPTAKERAAKYGGRPADYTALFTTHSQCTLNQRASETSALMRKLNTKEQHHG